ncbi:unnamed protein product [Withania somnifera]
MKPSLSLKKQNSNASTTSRPFMTIWSKDGGCPSGTVPIRRITKDDLIRQRDMPPPEPIGMDDLFIENNNNSEQKIRYTSPYGYKRAIVRTLKDPNAKFSGGGMATSLYNPHVEGKQFSGCRLKITKGSDVLQVGWRVDPTLYGDNKTRLFIHMQDTGIGNWWLLMGESYETIGFWPNRIFSDLSGFASVVDWGGVTYNPTGAPQPPMGSSFFPTGNSTYDAYCRSIAVSNEKGESVGITSALRLTENYFAYDALLKRVLVGYESFDCVLYGGPALLVLCLLLSYNRNRVQGAKKLSKLEDKELEKQLKLLNKPAIKIIKTKYGDIYSCVDFYKQHVFDHPSIWSKDGGCPSGTVPIRRITKDNLIRQRDMPLPEPVDFDDQFVGRAIVRTLKDRNAKFSGGGMATSLYNPHVEGKQFSGCRLKITKGSDVLQVGWRVDPTLYGDNKTRLFIHMQDNLSQRGVETWEITMYIYRDTGIGNWWLLMGESYEPIGFWPNRIFTDLAGFASVVDWGGVTYNPPGLPEPPMAQAFSPLETLLMMPIVGALQFPMRKESPLESLAHSELLKII